MIRIILISIISVFSILSHAGEFAVSPLVINIEGDKNKRIPFEFTIKAKKAGDVVLKVFDLQQIETGHMGFIEGDKTNKESKINWIKLNDEDFSIKQNDFVIARGDIKIPATAKGQHLAAIMVEEKPDPAKAQGVTVSVRYAVVLKIDAQSGKVQRVRTKTIFENLSFKKIEQGWEFEGFFENQSDMEGNLTAELQLRGSDKKLVGKLNLKTLSAWQRSEEGSMVYPGSKVKIYGVLPEDIADGVYQVRVKNKFNDRTQPIFSNEIVINTKGS